MEEGVLIKKGGEGTGTTTITPAAPFWRGCISELTSVTTGFVCVSMEEPQPIAQVVCPKCCTKFVRSAGDDIFRLEPFQLACPALNELSLGQSCPLMRENTITKLFFAR